MRIQISFLGAGDYQRCRYQYNGQIYETPYFHEAAQHFFGPDRVLILCTPEAAQKHSAALSDSFEAISIPSGKTEEELWELFTVLTEHVPEGATLIVDVTHSFRTQPMLALAAAYFLRTVRSVQIEHIVYGAFEARDAATGEVPVFDLMPFVQLINWSVAVHQFVHYGQSKDLADLIKDVHKTTYLTPNAKRAKFAAKAASSLKRFAQGLQLVRIQQVHQELAPQLLEALDKVQQDVQTLPSLRPLGVLLDQTQKRIRPLGAAHPFTREGLKSQAALIQLMLDFDLVQQAVTTAREAVVTRYALDRGENPCKKREALERCLGALSRGLQDKNQCDQYSAEERELAELWNTLSNIRNDINHGGMRPHPIAEDKLYKNAREVVQKTAAWITRQADEAASPSSG